MHIKINKKYLSLNNYKAKCAVGKRGIGYKRREGDLITPVGSYKIKYILYRKDRIRKIQTKIKKFEIKKKYQFLDDIFLRVLEKHPDMMPSIFFKMFKSSPKTVIKFLSNKSNLFEDLSIILKMPKITFIKALFY